MSLSQVTQRASVEFREKIAPPRSSKERKFIMEVQIFLLGLAQPRAGLGGGVSFTTKSDYTGPSRSSPSKCRPYEKINIQGVPFAKFIRECVCEQGRSRTQTARQRPAQNFHCANAARAPPRKPKRTSILRAPRERPRAEPRLRAISREFLNAARTPPVRIYPLYVSPTGRHLCFIARQEKLNFGQIILSIS